MQFANGLETMESMRERERKYHTRQDMQATMEDIMNEGFEEVYEEQESERPTPAFIDAEVAAIIREAIDPKLKARDYGLTKNDSIRNVILFDLTVVHGQARQIDNQTLRLRKRSGSCNFDTYIGDFSRHVEKIHPERRQDSKASRALNQWQCRFRKLAGWNCGL